MSQATRYKLAQASYWFLFVIGPAAGLFLILGVSSVNAGFCFGLGLILTVIGEHGFRPWKRLWKVRS
jgi:hypothetical protein